MSKGRILVVDPDEAYVEIEQHFTSQGYEVIGVLDATATLNIIALEGLPEVIVMGYRLTDTRGAELAQAIKAINRMNPPWIIQLTNHVHYRYSDAEVDYLNTKELFLRIEYFLKCHQEASVHKGNILVVGA
jgi:DNA-binding response OmpR family regulator